MVPVTDVVPESAARPASLQAAAMLLLWLCRTYACRSFVPICSAPNLFFGIGFLPSRLSSLISPGSENAGHVTFRCLFVSVLDAPEGFSDLCWNGHCRSDPAVFGGDLA
ncbi:MAG: hypothetical protein JW395_2070 [Nitrospira sp.]|nr:hypothetical protein [Nitrospira sp.]